MNRIWDRQLWRRHAKVFLAIFVPFFIAITIAFVFVVEQRLQRKTEELNDKSWLDVQLEANAMEQALGGAVTDVRILAQSDEFTDLVQGNPASIAGAEKLLRLFVAERGVYDQARLLDTSGQEVVRVNRGKTGVEVVPRGQLQYKGDRYYFRDSISLPRGAVYASPLDLNVENGVIERPYKPMIRIATGVYDKQQKLVGVMVLNYLAGSLLQKIRLVFSGGIEGVLLNSDGYWLYSRHKKQAWGFQLPHGRRFAVDYPDVWARLKQGGEDGQFTTAAGMFTYRVVRPFEAAAAKQTLQPQTAKGIGERYHWYLVGWVPVQQLEMLRHKTLTGSLTLYLAAVGLILILALAYARVKVGRLIAEERNRVAARVVETTHDAVMITDAQRRITQVNSGFNTLTGYSMAGVAGQDLKQFHARHYDGDHGQVIWDAVAQAGQWQGEVFVQRADGQFFAAMTYVGEVHADTQDGTHFVEILSDITERKETEAQLTRLAHYDGLTGLANRRLFEEHLEMAVAAAKRHGRVAAIFYADLDRFKPINDTFGHEAGDCVLKETGRRLRLLFSRETDTVSRLGGDEFAVVVAEVRDRDEAEQLRERIISTLSEPLTYATHHLTVGVSVGLALFPDDGDTTDALLKYADSLMYSAKRRKA